MVDVHFQISGGSPYCCSLYQLFCIQAGIAGATASHGSVLGST